MRTGSVSEAGRSLGRTQPAVSAMIAGLEGEIGFPLFERDRGRLVPKPEAHYFMEEAEFVLERLSQSARTLQAIGNLEKGTLRIACNPAASSFLMPQVISTFLEHKPDVKVSLMMGSSPVVVDWIASQHYDVGFAEALPERRTVDTETFEFPCVCAFPRGDALEKQRVVTAADLSGKPMALLYDGHTLTTQIKEAFRAAGAELDQRVELRTFLPALQLVAEGHCYTICETLTAASYQRIFGDRGGVCFRSFSPEIVHAMSLMTPANRPLSLLVDAFTAELRKQIPIMSSL